MAIFNLEYIEESKKNDSNEDVLDNILEACGYMLDALDEADKNLKNEKSHHSTHGPEDYSKYSTDNLKSEYLRRANASVRSKLRRDEADSYANGSDYGTSNRTKAASIGKELHKRGENVDKLRLGDLDDDTKAKLQQKSSSDSNRDALLGKTGYAPGVYYAQKKKAIKETCLAILSIIDDL